MRVYTGLVDRCFNACVNDFTSKTLMSKEVRYARLWLSKGIQLSVWPGLGDLRPELCRQVLQTFGTCWTKICRTKCWCVLVIWRISNNLVFFVTIELMEKQASGGL